MLVPTAQTLIINGKGGKMNIGTKYKLGADSLNIILYEKHKTKKNTVHWKAIGFYSNPHNTLKSLADMKIKESQLKDLKTITQKQDEIYALISSLPITKSCVAHERGV